MTVSMWVKFPSTVNGRSVFFSEGGTTAGTKLDIRLDSTGSINGFAEPLRVEINGAGLDFNAVGDVNLDNDAWHLITVETPANGSALSATQVYVDGQLQSVGSLDTNNSGNTISTTPTADVGFGLGSADGTAEVISNLYNGEMDDVAMFNSDLPQSEVTALYNGVSPLAVPEPTAIASISVVGAGLALRRHRRKVPVRA